MKIETLRLPEGITGPLLRLADVNGDKLRISWRQTTASQNTERKNGASYHFRGDRDCSQNDRMRFHSRNRLIRHFETLRAEFFGVTVKQNLRNEYGEELRDG